MNMRKATFIGLVSIVVFLLLAISSFTDVHGTILPAQRYASVRISHVRVRLSVFHTRVLSMQLNLW